MCKAAFLIVAILISAVVTCDGLEIRGYAQEVVDGAIVTWDPQIFAGFYYDIDDGIGNEQLTMTITGNKLEEPNGVMYTTTVQEKEFEFEGWGWYNSIGFLGEEYFAGYSDKRPIWHGYEIDPELYKRSTGRNTLVDEQLLKVLIDDDTERTITSSVPLKLADGYELAMKAIDIDGRSILVELMKDGQSVDTQIISPSKEGTTMSDQTYCYRKSIGDTENIVLIAVHFKNAFIADPRVSSVKGIIATVDGIFHVSEQPINISVDTQYGKMRISMVSDTSIGMDNKDNTITLNKNKDITLMADIHIKTADQDVIDADNPLRFYIYKEVTEPGTYEIRGAVQQVVDGATVTWDPKTFAGFYYDIDDNIGNEQITMTITGNKLEEPNGVKYTTTVQEKEFEFEGWGWYNSIGFLGEEYFAGYSDKRPIWHGYEIDPELYKRSTGRNTLVDEQLLKVLIDNSTEIMIEQGESLKLAEGYELKIKSLNREDGKLYLELLKDGKSVDTAEVPLSSPFATMSDQTYCYKKSIGDTENIVVLAVHFKNAVAAKDPETLNELGVFATVDGIFQVSDQPMDVSVDTEYDKMRISKVDATSIEMDNKDNAITLSKNQDVSLMAGIHIKTANQDIIDFDVPLRFYIYRNVTI
jgi:S-layer protein (TIGR01567 family)